LWLIIAAIALVLGLSLQNARTEKNSKVAINKSV